MKDSLIAAAALVVAVGGLAIMPVPELAFVLQGTGVGAVIGAVIGQRIRRGHPERDAGPYVVRWTLFGAGLCALIVLGALLVRGVA
jgi:hypothetical protein